MDNQLVKFTLSNGASILRISMEVDRSMVGGMVGTVLAERKDEWVVWTVDGLGSCTNGQYFHQRVQGNYRAALDCYRQRCN